MLPDGCWSVNFSTAQRNGGNFAKMKLFLPLVVWIVLLLRTANSQYSASRKNVGIFGLKHEVFFLNLEDGYFGCQVNESTDYLQLYELSKLCDGTSDCYMGSDELRNKLKCTNDCDKDGKACSNGVCLEGLCHCNDGFGGCNCQVPDENECKYRPCDVFAHCTNTLGSFTCTCFPGYHGDGFHCEDIDECQDPSIAARCVENAECCNLPAHFVCKCRPGFEGDGEERCTDVNECLDPQACGVNAECVNYPGNYTCLCKDGFAGDPYNGCGDIDECTQPGACGPGAICTNLEGGFRCDCPAGFNGDARSAQGCADYDECTRSPCGRNALCRNDVGSFRCECPEGFHGDPMTDCQAACTATDECSQQEVCSKGQCINPCHEPSSCGMNALCLMAGHFKQCSCPPGFTGDPALECVRIPTLCASTADCVDGKTCYDSMCVIGCGNDQECALNEKCIENRCLLTCRLDNDCFLGHICLNGRCVYGCHADDDCSASETCRGNRCTDPCRQNPCGPNAACTVVNHRASCSCISGMVPSPTAKVGCVRAPALQCTENRDCTQGTSCIENLCRPVCSSDQRCLNNERCDQGSCKPICRRDDDCRTGEMCQGQTCRIGCRSDAGCPAQLACINQQCVDPCKEPTACGTNAQCVVENHRTLCSCPAPLIGDPLVGCRAEQRSCLNRNDCPKGQACFSGTCMPSCRNDQNCLADERCVRGTCRTVCNSDASCPSGLICENRMCQVGCRTDNNCPANQACINKHCTDPCTVLGQCGTCSECVVANHGVQCTCPKGYLGNPLVSCSPPPQKCNSYCHCDEDGVFCADKCRQAKDCACGQSCYRGKCRTKCNSGSCPAGQLCQNGVCIAGCRSNADCGSELSCVSKKCVDPCANGKTCGKNTICQVADHQAFCLCFDGYQGDPRVECVRYECQTNNDCELDKKCSSGKCTNPCLQNNACGLNAQCRVVNRQPQCSCTPGFVGDARKECQPLQKESCSQNPCGENTICREDVNGYECSCQPGCMGDPKQGCLCQAKQTNKCYNFPCGKNAICRVAAHDQPECYCPPLYPGGDPYTECTNERTVTDCRTTGCLEGECVRDGTQFICRNEIGCRHNDECPAERSCINGVCINPCQAGSPCEAGQECEVQNHEPVCIKLCQCQKTSDCAAGLTCNGCNCIGQDVPDRNAGCAHCPPGIPCNPLTGACVKEPPGTPKIPEPCQSDADCIETEVCYMEVCENPCLIDSVCAPTATCHAKMHRPICTCPPGHEGNPTIKCTSLEPVQCTSNDECPLMEACVGNVCRRPCDVKNPCAPKAVCINKNHGSECSCIEGYHGNGFVSCEPVSTPGSVCQYNEDCPPDKLCDRLNRICINPCQEDSCGENAECFARNHGVECRCRDGFIGNAYIECVLLQGCRSDSECSTHEACVNGKCTSPCNCGANALCDVRDHKPQCKCPPGYKGDGRFGCSPPSNPCEPNPCGLNAMCEIDAGNPICFCPKGLTGNPFKTCIPEGDECKPNPCGPNSGCRKIDGKPSCFCLPEFEGNPPEESCKLPQNPCDPSPCGPNTLCTVLNNGFAKCTCFSGYIESPNTIRGCIEPRNPCEPNPCGTGAICDSSRNPVCYCPEGMIGNPFRSCQEPVVTPELCKPGPCGKNADCYVVEGREQCYCSPGFIGDAYIGCVEQPHSVCEPNPCGPGARCMVLTDGSAMCNCPPGLSGDPTSSEGCFGFECRVDDDCSVDKACIGFQCVDPCPGSCGTGAYCKVEKHHPVCFCNAGLTGNPALRCYSIEERVPNNQCNPGTCGRNTQCTIRNGRPICKCLPNYRGDPKKGCKAECELNSDCPSDKACVNRKCVPPCNGDICGVNAICHVEYHTPMCKCPNGYTGDAFVHCVMVPEERNVTRQPCQSSPCGPQGVCAVYGDDVALCDPCAVPNAAVDPHCRPQCILNTDCPFNLACLQGKCQDPCPGSCGYAALCTVELHRPVCSCPTGLYGNPYERCIQQDKPLETCDTIRCGANTDCKKMGGALACVCKKNYYGDPLVGCRPECVINTDCAVNKACINNRCQDPCVGVCGVNALCKVVNHLPVCYCSPTHTGDALISCTEKMFLPPDTTPCDPNPCGPNSKCLTTPDNYAVCSCLPGFRGRPPACQAECMINAECPQNKACINLKCVDPCPGTCGVGAQCEILNHNPICSCGSNQQGDPFVRCEPRRDELPPPTKSPCDPSPCGMNSICQVKRNRPVCSCQPNFIGSPPYCRPECVLSSECPQDKACINEKCQNPCENACGANADCHVVGHSAFCNCRAGFEGDAFIGCSEVPIEMPRKDACSPNPCAENALCSEVNGAAKCTCIAPYLGDPYSTGCRPECVLHSDCPSQLACVNQHCRDPCPGVCGSNAECIVANHIPVCECRRGFIGDPFQGCRRDVPIPVPPTDPCSQCPSNSVCRIVQGRPTCSCPEGYRGAPPACRPECSSNEECRHDQSCINLKCKDPCPGLCGINAQCQVINHKPFCSCLRDYYGNPFEQCMPKPVETVHPCQPSPCGPYSECREHNDRAVCTCVAGMFGAPPNCRPECETHQDCPSNRACFGQKCKDPCVGSCGFNAQCAARDHRPECYCMEGFEGDPYTGCNPIVIWRDEIVEPCNPSPCGSNAICKERNGAGSCTCMQDYFGDPYISCRPECVQNSDCPFDKSCSNTRCVDPCLGTCGLNAECRVHNHSPICNCVTGYVGNPSLACHVLEQPKEVEPIDPCSPSPCGPYSICRVANNHAVCSCQSNCIGAPPNCRPECIINSECSRDKSCVNQRCVDPCPGTCGLNARCRTVNHNPICSCNTGFTGDPFVQCSPEPIQPIPKDEPLNPCQPSPCGSNSVCRVQSNRAVCSCVPNYIGRPPNCRPECVVNSECPMNLACVNEKCVDPCQGSCGFNAECRVVSHSPMCTCYPEHTGDPFAGCNRIQIIQETPMPCTPSPCGVNAICREQNGAGSCSCLPEYFGDPYIGCRPECVMNSDCPRTRSCMNNKCVDPCPGTCGTNSECHMINHAPTCTCINGFVGNPFVSCTPQPVPEEPINPCQPSPCGPNSNCRVVNNHAVCSCSASFIGSPPNCRPECVVSSECPLDKSCVNRKCKDPCPGACGLNARCQVVNHNPICSCKNGFTGDPFIRCIPEEKTSVRDEIPINPCEPSPCGPNSQCKPVGQTAACSCLPNYVGRAPNCRPECTSSSECSQMQACINEKCKDPCPGSCGTFSTCTVQNHQPNCRCYDGYTGDPFSTCIPIPIKIEPEIVDPCNPSPCGINAECNVRNNAGSCTCLPEYFGDPYVECRPECVLNTDCPKTQACLNNKCKDPCIGICGLNAECYVSNHSPMCSCITGFVGNPSVACNEIPKMKDPVPINPCRPSPCGPYSECREVNTHAVCSCQQNYIGSPPACRAECVVSSECIQDKACINQKCIDPCPGTCGLNARCSTINHNPICSCSPGFTGDPFIRCLPEEKRPEPKEPDNPCIPNPCGPNSQCRAVGAVPACSCLRNYIGRAPNCRPECTINSECAGNLACINEKCQDPCPGSCGLNAICNVINHSPVCSCSNGYTGDPFSGCMDIPTLPVLVEKQNPCNPSPCGPNAVCKERNGAGSCTCLPEYFGDPYSGCRPECVTNSDCPRNKACVNNKCKDPCPGVCGINAECYVANHSPNCNCISGFSGDPLSACHEPTPPKMNEPINPCSPSPCGPNSICREINGHAVCSCQIGLIGTPPNCRPECVVSSECARDKACLNQKCQDPCPGTCGLNARCQIVNHSPICSCSPGFSGDPFTRCLPEKKPVVSDNIDPCIPSPCGPNSQCRAVGNTPACSCLPNYIGRAPNCRPECMIDAECPANLACVNEKCKNPCAGSCGLNAICTVIKHSPVCSCQVGFTGDPFSVCTEFIPPRTPEPTNPCNPSPCGANAVCKERNGAGSCTCLQDYFGDPYTGCRPECVQNSDCDKFRACVNNKCKDPCPGVCGLNAECTVQNHSPICFCIEGYTGDPSRGCSIEEIITERPKLEGCYPSPCGPNSLCREVNGHPVCSCKAGYIGSPPSCRPECVVSSECSQDRACVNEKCTDPCPGTCGAEARCQVVNHNPICSCPPGFSGDPFIQCTKQEISRDPPQPTDPCLPSPCGPNSHCRVVGTQAACTCQTNYIGRPPNCRPECTIDAECASNLACQNERCSDPCPGACGYNAICQAINHRAVCTCTDGYEGNPLVQCERLLPPTTERLTPCTPSPCGPNAECRERNNAGACYCLRGYEGNPYDVFSGCRRECDVNSDCAEKLACVNYKCVDPCPGVCGSQALCEIANHIPTCVCPEGMAGDPFTQCVLKIQDPITKAPPICDQSTCGPNSICRILNGVAICKCQPEMIGSPPNCKPECTLSADCDEQRTCTNYKCVDPCPGSCGQNAKCQVINHNPICSCSQDFTGDPFSRCYKEIITTTAAPPTPCLPSPCGPNAECKVVGNNEACSCLPDYIGSPPNCRPECILNTECKQNQACIRQKCTDPCPGSCGLNAKCSVVNHTPSCSCEVGYTGDPFTNCQFIQAKPPPAREPEPRDPCYSSPCGTNARCRPIDGGSVCECFENYFGNPYSSCRPECVSNSECSRNTACIQNRCKDPCPGVCGYNAECSVINHTPTCTCPDGMVGNAFEQCFREPVITAPADPCYPSPCGLNTICRASNGNAVCECLPEFKGTPFGKGCHPECTINSDCPRDRTCVNKKCVDPCPGVCGYRAVCHAINNSPVCSCPSNMIGDPFVECKEAPPKDPCSPSPCRTNGICRVVGGRSECQYPECVINSDCSWNRACLSQKCSDPCIGACGVNAICNVVNHAPICSCPEHHVGSPFVQCSRQMDPIPQPECVSDEQCTNDKACINQQCINPCADQNGLCNVNAECRVQFHRAICTCREGFTGNAQLACYEIGCRSDSDCPATEACVNRNCVDPCTYTQCGRNSVCRTDYNHIARCHCLEGYRGNPLTGCTRPECTRNDECPYHLACQNENCVDPCNCAPGAQCRVDNHRASCRCPPGYSGDASFACEKVPERDTAHCKIDADCPSKMACFSGLCKNPCVEAKPCAEHAICTVQDTLPLRTMFCVCEEGYIGDAEKRCLPVSTSKPGCSSDIECAATETCRNRICTNPCVEFNPCARTAECLAQSHKAICSCPVGMIGDPFQNCYSRQPNNAECVADSECSSNRACINNNCLDPCAEGNPCAGNAECRTQNHRPLCTCPQGWGGDPKTQCYKPECQHDNDCPYDKACHNGNCLNPCTYGTIQCGRGAECSPQGHRANCICPAGTQGNPFISCITGLCQYNEDCADHEACDRLNRVCRPVCDDQTCATRAICMGRNHQPTCECLSGTRGNPYIECARDEPVPACSVDSDCPSQQACINNNCENPCVSINPCPRQQTCTVVDTLPLRTMICACPTDMLIDVNVQCKPIVTEECHTNNDCSDTDICIRGRCMLACRAEPCGVNAQCISKQHRAHCSCAPEYVGNAHIECTPEARIPTPKECTIDADCPQDRSCLNEKCINPCMQDVCGRGAICHVQEHNAVCKCPAGHTMDRTSNGCIPPAGDLPKCRSNSECTTSESCVNEICANPCNCGENANCYVKDHYPVCTCKPGYSGNAQFGCIKLGCQSNSECPNDKQCYNGECLNPCALENPCALNAECYGDRHQAACRCLPGLEGNPFVKCRSVECHFDGECPDNRACIQEQCVDPCNVVAPCAQNAICFTRSHVAHCKCPDHLPDGNPFSFCEHRIIIDKPECTMDAECPSRLACINEKCVDACKELQPCAKSATCTVLDSIPVRTMVCECPDLHVPDTNGECKRLVFDTSPECTRDSQCSENEACINHQCRSPCNCGEHATCTVKNHRGVCSCENGFEGNPNIACRTIGCRVDSECESGKACVNGNCVNPCLDKDPCGINAECHAVANRAECRCLSGYRGNPLIQCMAVECRSNNDCPNDKQCRNSQCVDPCVYDSSCSPRAECKAQNHLAICRCPPGLVGNPYVDCRPEIIPECLYDTDCPSHLACIEDKCVEPCSVLQPCNLPAKCEAIPSSPVRTMICICPDGYVSSGSGTCKPVVKSGCIADSDCSSDTACINSICRNPCNCGPNAECRIKDHKPVCSCKQGYDGNPEIECVKIECRTDDDCSGQHSCINRQCISVCSIDSCGRQAECYAQNHRAICECLPGYAGDPRVSCKLLGCRSDSDCPLDKACINNKCENPCDSQAICAQNELCQVYQHRPECACSPPFETDPIRGCVMQDDRCRTDGECPSQLACIQSECVNPCNVTKPCGVNSMCKVLDTLPVRTMICECLPGYQGNAAIQCDKMALCPVDRGFIRNANGECVCPPGYGLTHNEDCQICRVEDGMKVDETGRCVCALERGMVVDERGRCICPTDYGYRLTERGNCVRTAVPECTHDDDCPDWKYCDQVCKDPCQTKICGKNALCNATNHQAVCQCIAGYTGDPEDYCNQTTNFRTDFPQPDMQVTCQADGVQVVIDLMESNFNGVLYVKGHSKDEECRRVVNLGGDASQRTQIFKVHFGSCGLIHINGIASFVLVIQKHPKLVTYKAQAYHIKCVYQTGEQNVTLGFNVQMLTTAGTIANTGPPPTCAMRIVAYNGEEINSAEIGDNLRLQVEVQPATIYGGFARSCVAKTMEDSVENEYIVTDENGCATEPSIFGDWEYNPESNSLLASFNAFKFPSSDNIRFQCNIRVCFGRCQPVNCHGANAFGKRRRRAITDMNEIELMLNRTRRATSTALASDDLLGIEGTLREEITIQSNAILTLERREERSYDSDNITPAAQRVEDICVSMIGLIIALVITALLALVAVAVAVSCWLMAYRRRPTITGPLPHPPEFPNPLFAHHEPSEPSHNYMT